MYFFHSWNTLVLLLSHLHLKCFTGDNALWAMNRLLDRWMKDEEVYSTDPSMLTLQTPLRLQELGRSQYTKQIQNTHEKVGSQNCQILLL